MYMVSNELNVNSSDYVLHSGNALAFASEITGCVVDLKLENFIGHAYPVIFYFALHGRVAETHFVR